MIKYSLMSYFRYERQWLCATECNQADVMAISHDISMEVEIKISKYDLWKGEARKNKHPLIIKNELSKYRIPNKFYICVPICLLGEAKKWVDETSNKYGIIRYDKEHYPTISMDKRAGLIHSHFSEDLKNDIMMRVCSENIRLMRRK